VVLGGSMKKFLGTALFFLFVFGSNFLIFSVAYNKLATPFLTESQRVENADLIMNGVLPAYFFTAILSALVFYFFKTKK
jgi:hypothetical protein